MTDIRKAAEQALDTLEHVQAHIGRYDPPVVTTIARSMQPTIDALRAALAAEQPQPVLEQIRQHLAVMMGSAKALGGEWCEAAIRKVQAGYDKQYGRPNPEGSACSDCIGAIRARNAKETT